MRGDGASPQLMLPTLHPWVRNVLVGLFALFVVELVARNVGVPVDALAWWPFGGGFQVWQPLTRFLVQGGSSRAVVNVVFGLLVLYFLLPAVDAMMPRDRWVRGLIAGAVGGTLVPLVGDAAWFQGPPTSGWTLVTSSLFVLFGLGMPSGVMNLWFVIPITGRVIVWATFGLALVFFLIDPGLRTAEALGTWGGVYAWWHLAGPGGRRRSLVRQARKVERELHRFEVIEGGKDKPKDRKGKDDWIH